MLPTIIIFLSIEGGMLAVYLTSTIHDIDLQTLSHNVCYETAKGYCDIDKLEGN